MKDIIKLWFWSRIQIGLGVHAKGNEQPCEQRASLSFCDSHWEHYYAGGEGSRKEKWKIGLSRICLVEKADFEQAGKNPVVGQLVGSFPGRIYLA